MAALPSTPSSSNAARRSDGIKHDDTSLVASESSRETRAVAMRRLELQPPRHAASSSEPEGPAHVQRRPRPGSGRETRSSSSADSSRARQQHHHQQLAPRTSLHAAAKSKSAVSRPHPAAPRLSSAGGQRLSCPSSFARPGRSAEDSVPIPATGTAEEGRGSRRGGGGRGGEELEDRAESRPLKSAAISKLEREISVRWCKAWKQCRRLPVCPSFLAMRIF